MRVQDILDKPLTVTIDDVHPRQFRGILKGTDRDMNLILAGTTEVCFGER